MKTKICPTCKQEKPLTDFYRRKRNRDGYTYVCKVCQRKTDKQWYQKNKKHHLEKSKQWYQKNKKYVQEYLVAMKYGITSERYNQMFIEQNGRCAICGKHQSEFKIRLAVDHDRETGQVRGLLCPKCNPGLGFFEHDPNRLQAAIKYLKETRIG